MLGLKSWVRERFGEDNQEQVFLAAT